MDSDIIIRIIILRIWWNDGQWWMGLFSLRIIGFSSCFDLIGIFLDEKSRNSIYPMERNSITIVKERYSKGEITRDEYLKLIEDLKK